MNSLPVQIFTDVGSAERRARPARLGLGAGARDPDPPHHPHRAARVAQEPTLVTDSDTKTMTDDPRTSPTLRRRGARTARSAADPLRRLERERRERPGGAAGGAGHLGRRRCDAFYGAGHAIKDVSIDYAPNKVTAMIGPSGSGKSTVLRCLNRMHEEIPGARATGTVLLDGDDIYGSARRRRRRAPRDRDGLPEAQPVPDDVDLRQRGGGAEAQRRQGRRPEGARRAVAARRRRCGRRSRTA